MKRIAAIVVGLALLIPSSALADSGSTCQAYNPQDCQPINNTRTVASSSSTLPFTGFDALLLAAGGAVLLGAGLVVRRVSRNLD